MEYSKQIHEKLEDLAEVAGFLWQKNWAECNGGNISINLSDYFDKDTVVKDTSEDEVSLNAEHSILSGNYIYVSGTGKSMREIAKSPLGYGSIIRISDDGKKYRTVSQYHIPPTSELPSHLAIHSYLLQSQSGHRAVLHTHPTELIALSHCKPFVNSDYLTKTLWSMIPETRVFIPKGLGVVPYARTGSELLAELTIKHLKKHDAVMWEKHGILAVDENIRSCFDRIDALNKSAQIYLLAKSAGFKPQGLTRLQMDELAEAFGLTT